ncbi:MAG: cob(I)yrinic acid a,c-diamide adenosyltransferase [Negativibacillus sp.]|nr:cob(I)yrinic acid a,c-diamide adenosyltransferase [Negativibacillus sp.]
MMENKNEQGLIHLYCGDGKGKTTAALGLAVRAAGHDKRVVIVQFLKSTDTGELHTLKRIPNIEVIRSNEPLGFTFRMNEQEKQHAVSIQQELFSQALSSAQHCDLLILDEIMAAINSGMVSVEQVVQLIDTKPQTLELVMTGRNPPSELVERADYFSEIRKIKHPFDRGIPARDAIER